MRALALLDDGLSLNEVGRRIGCNPSSVMRWRDARRHGGPEAQGYRTNLWTTARIAEMVEREFGVRHHRDHIGRLMHSLGWTPQKPERRALERDEDEIRWKTPSAPLKAFATLRRNCVVVSPSPN